MNVDIKEDCYRYLTSAMQIASMTADELRIKNRQWKIEKFTELTSLKDSYRNNCSNAVSYGGDSSNIVFFDLAALNLASSLKNGEGGDEETEKILQQFSSAEFNAFLRLDSYSAIDHIKPEDISSSIFNKGSRVYDIINKWYQDQMFEYNKLSGLEENSSEIRPSLRKALADSYAKRLNVVKRGIELYINKYPGAILKLFRDYEDSVGILYSAERNKNSITEDYERLINSPETVELVSRSDELEDLISDLVERIHDIEARGRQGILSTEEMSVLRNFFNRINDESKKVETMLHPVKEKLSYSLTTIETTKSELESRITKLQASGGTESDEKLVELNHFQISRLKASADFIRDKINSIGQKLDYIREQVDSVGRRVDELASTWNDEEATTIVRTAEALAMEEDIVNRFEKKMIENLPLQIPDPIRNDVIKIKDANSLNGFKSDVRGASDTGNDEKNIPLMRAVTYDFVRDRFLKGGLRVKLELLFLPHSPTYRKNFADRQPVILPEFLSTVMKTIKTVSGDDFHNVLAVASPTGFSREVVDRIAGEKGIMLKTVSIVLIDLARGNTYYNTADATLRNFVKFFDLEIEDEGIIKARKHIEEKLKSREILVSEELVPECSNDVKIVKRAMYEIEKTGRAKVYVDGDSVAIRRL